MPETHAEQAPVTAKNERAKKVVFGILYAGILAAMARVGWMDEYVAVFVFCMGLVRGPLAVTAPVVALAFAGLVVLRLASWPTAMMLFVTWLVYCHVERRWLLPEKPGP